MSSAGQPATGIGKNPRTLRLADMLVIRRMINRRAGYTVIFLRGEPPQIFPTSDYEHARILEIYKQNRRYPDVLNDFTDYDLPGSCITTSDLAGTAGTLL